MTYAENSLRIYSGNPLPLTTNGFISFYFDKWFDLTITNYQLTMITYFAALLFLSVSVEWISPYVNLEIIKLRKFLGLLR